MNKLKLEVSALIDKFQHHDQLKDHLVDLIDKADNDTEMKEAKNWEYHISKCDWNNNTDFKNRPWVYLLKPYLQNHFNKCANFMLYKEAKIKALWYQQYNQNDAHGWHIHGDNYTGVYYLQLPEGSSKTELVNHYKQDEEIQTAQIEAKEGDIIIFPSFVVHRSPKIDSDVTKTIISFNLEFNGIKENV